MLKHSCPVPFADTRGQCQSISLSISDGSYLSNIMIFSDRAAGGSCIVVEAYTIISCPQWVMDYHTLRLSVYR